MSDAFTTLVIQAQTAIAGATDREEGQTLVEYALILALVSIGTIAALIALTGKINSVFTTITNAL
jgi:Flp pilus assembly pilin Flp